MRSAAPEVVSLNHPAVRAILRRARIVQIATRSARGRPFLTPLWFVVDRGAVHLTTLPTSRAGRNIAADPQVALLFRTEPGTPPATIVRVYGRGTVHHGILPTRVLVRLALRYYLAPAALRVELRHRHLWSLRLAYYAQAAAAGTGYLRVEPLSAELLRPLDGEPW